MAKLHGGPIQDRTSRREEIMSAKMGRHAANELARLLLSLRERESAGDRIPSSRSDLFQDTPEENGTPAPVHCLHFPSTVRIAVLAPCLVYSEVL